MNDLERLRQMSKLIALVGIVIFEKKLVNMIMPKNPILIRKLLIVGGTAMLVSLTGELILSNIDKRFDRIISEVEKDAIGMLS